MKPWEIFVIFLLSTALFVSVTEANGVLPYGKCLQCIGGNFTELKWMMHDPHRETTMWWKESWEGTDCVNGIFNIHPHCDAACVTVYILKYTNTGYEHDAVLKDCSESLFLQTPDLPDKYLISRSNEDGHFTSRRRPGYEIRYRFTRRFENRVEDSVEEDRKLLFKFKKAKMTEMTEYIYATLGFLCGFLLIYVFFSLLKAVCKKSSDKIQMDDVRAIELNPIQVRYNSEPLVSSQEDATRPAPEDTINYQEIEESEAINPFESYQRGDWRRPPSAFSDVTRGLLRVPPFDSEESLNIQEYYAEDQEELRIR